jgi:glycerol-3-phosphate acyltransferase PlsY
MIIYLILLPLIAYLIGSIPFGLIFAKSQGIDIRSQGSGNIGATNVARVMGKKIGLLTLFFDLSKGLLPIIFARFYFESVPERDLIISLMGFFAIMGHCYPVFLKFKGGKGVATAAGVFLGICPMAAGVGFAMFMLMFQICRIVSVSSITASISIPFAVYLCCPSDIFFKMALISSIIIIYKHKENIMRLLNGEEKRLNLGRQA